MAQSIRAVNVTPADELRELLTRDEKLVVNLKGSGARALELLLDLDRISELWPRLEAQGVDLRAESGRWETLQASVRRHAPRLVREMRAGGGLPAARLKHHPGGAAPWWWFLAEQMQAQRSRRQGRAALVLGSTALAVTLIYWLLFHVLFPTDPSLRAAIQARNAGELKITGQDDFAGALADFRRAAELQPGDPDAWLRVGCTLLRLGDERSAQENFHRAEVLLADEVTLRLTRAPVCSLLGLTDHAEADLRAVIEIDPENALAYYYLSTIFEERQAFGDAMAALEHAAELAERSEEPQLVAMARFRLGMLMQQMTGRGPMATTPPPE